METASMINRLQNVGISFVHGMTAEELDRAEQFFGFRFPKEIREFLSLGVPVGNDFFSYRDVSEENRKVFLDFQNWIEKKFLYDLVYNREEMVHLLGARLGNAEDFDTAVLDYFHSSVKLIPFFAHRCFFDGMDGLPIVSFWQPVDSIFYGGDFENYLECEFLNGQYFRDPLLHGIENTGIWYDQIW